MACEAYRAALACFSDRREIEKTARPKTYFRIEFLHLFGQFNSLYNLKKTPLIAIHLLGVLFLVVISADEFDNKFTIISNSFEGKMLKTFPKNPFLYTMYIIP